ncbi:MAG: hypothetical protein HOL15_01690 [Nitrospinaceae bacterium]|nr:hypothetical protein [Nitrospinaceae bacterium]MBT6345721.1 hypothetical protein [Nitrospina sp.]
MRQLRDVELKQGVVLVGLLKDNQVGATDLCRRYNCLLSANSGQRQGHIQP